MGEPAEDPTSIAPPERTVRVDAPFPRASLPGLDDTEDRPGIHVRLFGSRMFFRLWMAQVVSALGDWLGFLGITILAAKIAPGDEAAAVGLVMSARIVPGFFLAPVAGVLVDRWDRKKVMVVCDVGRAVVIATLPFVDTVFGLVIASLVLEVGTLLWSPAKEASVPNLVPADRLASANSLSLAAAYGTFPIAAGLFALLAQVAKWLGGIDALDALRVNQEALAFYVDVLTFLASAFLISRLALPRVATRPADGDSEAAAARAGFKQTLQELKEGWHFVFLNPVVRAVNVGLATGLMGGGMVVPLGTVFSITVLGADATGYGVFIFALGMGVAVGVIGVSVTQRRLPKAKIFTLALFFGGASLIAAASMWTLLPAALFVAGLGVAAGAVYVLGFTLLHETVEDELRGRIFAALYTLVRLCLLIAFAIGPFLSELLGNLSADLFEDQRIDVFGSFHVDVPGVRLTLWLAGLVIIAAGVLSFLSLRAGDVRESSAEDDDARLMAAARELLGERIPDGD